MRAAPVTLVLLFAVPAAAQDHPLVQEGIAHYQEASFEDALAAFARAEEGDDLSRDDLVTLLLYRALIHFGLEADEERDRALLALASIAPDYAFDDRVPPAVQEAFDRMRARIDGPVGVEADVEAGPGTVRVRGRAVDDPGELVRAVRVGARAPVGQWVQSDGGDVQLPVTADAVEYWIEAVGPGGAVIARSGTEADPVRHPIEVREERTEPTTGPVATPLPPESADDRDGGGGSAWPWIVAGGAVAVAAAVVVTLLVIGAGDRTAVSPPQRVAP